MTSQQSFPALLKSALVSRIPSAFYVIPVLLFILVPGVGEHLAAQSPEPKQSPVAALKKKHRWRITETAKTETVKSASEALMIEGNTEDVATASASFEADPLRIALDDNFLTIRSKKQPLVAVVPTAAEVLEVPAEFNMSRDR